MYFYEKNDIIKSSRIFECTFVSQRAYNLSSEEKEENEAEKSELNKINKE